MTHVDPGVPRDTGDISADVLSELLNKGMEKSARKAGGPIVDGFGRLMKAVKLGKVDDVAKQLIKDNPDVAHFGALLLGPVLAGVTTLPDFLGKHLPTPVRRTAEIAFNAFLRNLPESMVEEVKGKHIHTEGTELVMTSEDDGSGKIIYILHPAFCIHAAGKKDVTRVPEYHAIMQLHVAKEKAKKDKTDAAVKTCDLWVDLGGHNDKEHDMTDKMNFKAALEGYFAKRAERAAELDEKAKAQTGKAKKDSKDQAVSLRKKAAINKKVASLRKLGLEWVNYLKARPHWTVDEVEEFLDLNAATQHELIDHEQPETPKQKTAREAKEKVADEEDIHGILTAIGFSDEAAQGKSKPRTLFSWFGK